MGNEFEKLKVDLVESATDDIGRNSEHELPGSNEAGKTIEEMDIKQFTRDFEKNLKKNYPNLHGHKNKFIEELATKIGVIKRSTEQVMLTESANRAEKIDKVKREVEEELKNFEAKIIGTKAYKDAIKAADRMKQKKGTDLTDNTKGNIMNLGIPDVLGAAYGALAGAGAVINMVNGQMDLAALGAAVAFTTGTNFKQKIFGESIEKPNGQALVVVEKIEGDETYKKEWLSTFIGEDDISDSTIDKIKKNLNVFNPNHFDWRSLSSYVKTNGKSGLLDSAKMAKNGEPNNLKSILTDQSGIKNPIINIDYFNDNPSQASLEELGTIFTLLLSTEPMMHAGEFGELLRYLSSRYNKGFFSKLRDMTNNF